MAIPSDVQDALDRLGGGYNNGAYNASTNTLGFSSGGHRHNLFALTGDVVEVGGWMDGVSEAVEADRQTVASDKATVVSDKASVTASAASVAADKAAVDAALAAVAGGPVISINGKTGVVFTDPLSVVDVQPTLDFDFTNIKGAAFKGKFSRATAGGYRRNAKGVLVPTVVDEPMIDYGANGRARGAGFYGAFSNLLLRSQEFDVGWGPIDVTVMANAVAAPDGTMTADKLVSSVNGGPNTCYIGWLASVAPNTDYTFSVYLRRGTAPKAMVNFYRNSPYAATFATITWGVEPTLAIVDQGGICLASSIDMLPDGWVRVSITVNSASATQMVCRVYVRGNAADNVLGEYTYGWGAQLTATAYPAPYVPTTSAAVVRNADSMVIGGSDFTDFFNPLEGTFFVDYTLTKIRIGRFQEVINVSDGTANNVIALRDFGGVAYAVSIVAGVEHPTVSFGNIVPPQRQRVAYSYRAGALAGARNGVVAAGGAIQVGVFNRLTIASAGWALADHLNDPIARLIYWPRALDATLLQRMTA